MKLYIPEIGDQLKLTEDWCFELHAESRNNDLAALYGYYFGSNGWIDEKLVPIIRQQDYEVQYPDYDYRSFKSHEYNEMCREAENNCPEYVNYWRDYKEWCEKCNAIAKPTINIVLPAGTIIKVDRIYIRKGISEYSSITFFATGLGKVIVNPAYSWGKKKNKSSLRFWSKLSDCNNIMFEKHI